MVNIIKVPTSQGPSWFDIRRVSETWKGCPNGVGLWKPYGPLLSFQFFCLWFLYCSKFVADGRLDNPLRQNKWQ